MTSAALPFAAEAGPSRGAVRAGWALSGLAILFFAMDGAMKLSGMPVVAETSAALGWPSDPATIYLLAALLLGSTLLYAVPRTAVLGAILLTGYLGGAVATHVRVGSPLFSHILFGVYLGVFVWGGLWLRDPRLRALLPFTS
jgi:hypothetical protein